MQSRIATDRINTEPAFHYHSTEEDERSPVDHLGAGILSSGTGSRDTSRAATGRENFEDSFPRP